MARDIKNVEIFGMGTWFNNKGKNVITSDDLDGMVTSFEALGSKPGFTPALKLGHSAMQKFFGNSRGAPRLGFVETIWRAGDKILANFSQVPDELVDLIEKGRYNQVSVEVFPKYEFEGTIHKFLLTAVAVLGAELPAVKGLKDLSEALFKEEEFDKDQTRVSFTQKEKSMDYTEKEHQALLTSALLAQKTELESAFAAKSTEFSEQVSAQATEIGELREAQATFEADKAQFAEEQRMVGLKAVFDQGVLDGKLLPKQESSMMAMASGLAKFEEAGRTEVQLFEDFVKDLPKSVDFSEKTEGDGADDVDMSAGEQLHAKTTKTMAEDAKLTYADARERVLSADPDLKKRYTEDQTK